jgi:hypothetical protein
MVAISGDGGSFRQYLGQRQAVLGTPSQPRCGLFWLDKCRNPCTTIAGEPVQFLRIRRHHYHLQLKRSKSCGTAFIATTCIPANYSTGSSGPVTSSPPARVRCGVGVVQFARPALCKILQGWSRQIRATQKAVLSNEKL